jgi:hypothetical protein
MKIPRDVGGGELAKILRKYGYKIPVRLEVILD